MICYFHSFINRLSVSVSKFQNVLIMHKIAHTSALYFFTCFRSLFDCSRAFRQLTNGNPVVLRSWLRSCLSAAAFRMLTWKCRQKDNIVLPANQPLNSKDRYIDKRHKTYYTNIKLTLFDLWNNAVKFRTCKMDTVGNYSNTVTVSMVGYIHNQSLHKLN